MSRLLLAVAVVALLCVVCAAQPFSAPLLIGRVTVNRTHIAFSYAGDIWTVERAGGEARRLTTHAGEESFPFFSPDGSQLAFSRQINGDWDIYVMPVGGGDARRLTYMPEDDHVMGWTPDGKSVLFTSHRDEEGVVRLWRIALDGVMPEALPLPQAFAGSYSPDGARIVYQPTNSFGEYRFYRGGMLSSLRVANLSTGALERLPHGNHNDRLPFWVGNKIYFTSDRTGTFNLYSYDFGNKQTKQLTSFERFGIRTSGGGGDAVAFVQEGRIHLHDMTNGQTRAVEVRVNPETPEWKERTANAARNIESATLAEDGKRVVFGARGEAVVYEPDGGAARNLTQTSRAAERSPALSPDGRSVAYFSDESGEYQLHIKPADGAGAVKKISVEQKPSFYRELSWSPDSQRIAFSDRRLGLWVADAARGTTARIDVSRYTWQGEYFPAWSPDSRWLAYSKFLMPHRVRTVFVYDTRDAKTRQITDGRTHTESPVFDAGGKYLYFISSSNAGSSEFGWSVLSGMLARPLVTRTLHAVVLQSNASAPVFPNRQANPEAKFDEAAKPVVIDFENIGERIVNLPQPARDYAQLASAKPGVLHVLVAEWPKSPAFANPSHTLYRYDLTKPQAFDKLVEEINAFELSRDGRRMLYAKGRGDWFLAPADAAPKPDEGRLDLKKLEVTIDPRAEWVQIYREAWRLMRDTFYDPNHHGQNLPMLEQHFAAYLPSVTRRADLNVLMNQMLGHISVSHLGVGGGDMPPPASQPTRIAMLGADFDIDRGRYRFKRIYRTSHYNDPGGSQDAPLDQPGAQVREGEYLLAVGGQNVDTSKNVYSYFEVKSPAAIKITVGASSTGEGARTLSVFPMPGENGLRRAQWAKRNRQLVEQMSGGKLGYVYVGDFGTGGVANLIRGLNGYSDKEGLIIDQRFNGGGITPDSIIEWLRRKPLYYYMFREGADQPTPVNPSLGAKVLLVNEHNGSAAETMAFMYKLGRVGPLVGMRTYGGGIGPSGFTPQFIDGGRAQIPNRAAYHPDGTSWGIENVGVAPDYTVEITPQDWMAGRDPQLVKAVQVALEEVRKNPPSVPKHPKYPVHK